MKYLLYNLLRVIKLDKASCIIVLLAQHEIIGSMSKKGDCWDNAVAESFFHTLKVELIHRMKFRTREEAKRKIFEYVEMYYNTKRAHSTLGYLSPFEYERQAILSK